MIPLPSAHIFHSRQLRQRTRERSAEDVLLTAALTPVRLFQHRIATLVWFFLRSVRQLMKNQRADETEQAFFTSVNYSHSFCLETVAS